VVARGGRREVNLGRLIHHLRTNKVSLKTLFNAFLVVRTTRTCAGLTKINFVCTRTVPPGTPEGFVLTRIDFWITHLWAGEKKKKKKKKKKNKKKKRKKKQQQQKKKTVHAVRTRRTYDGY
jgi:hypothetical protein